MFNYLKKLIKKNEEAKAELQIKEVLKVIEPKKDPPKYFDHRMNKIKKHNRMRNRMAKISKKRNRGQ
jgi:hypothetical protein